MPTNGLLQLPSLPSLDPLTKGTNLPPVPNADVPPPDRNVSTPAAPRGEKRSEPEPDSPPSQQENANASAAAAHDAEPDRERPHSPATMRRFLSRVSLNNSYPHSNHRPEHPHDDKASVFSTPLSVAESKKSKKGSGGSWWKRARRSSAFITPVQETAVSNSSPQLSSPPPAPVPAPGPQRHQVQSIPPPPRLPDDMFGAGLSSLDHNMFKDFK